MCENCETVLASIYCQADSAHLCEKCDVEIHRSKLASRHVRISLEKASVGREHVHVHVHWSRYRLVTNHFDVGPSMCCQLSNPSGAQCRVLLSYLSRAGLLEL